MGRLSSSVARRRGFGSVVVAGRQIGRDVPARVPTSIRGHREGVRLARPALVSAVRRTSGLLRSHSSAVGARAGQCQRRFRGCCAPGCVATVPAPLVASVRADDLGRVGAGCRVAVEAGTSVGRRVLWVLGRTEGRLATKLGHVRIRWTDFESPSSVLEWRLRGCYDPTR
jgi:hypothetical protein